MNNPLTYIRKKKKFLPTTKLRYAVGLGDIISAILHSKFIGPITYIFTGKLEPCTACNNRRVILNQLFPINLWSYFFKTLEDMHDDIKQEYIKIGMDYVYISPKSHDPVSVTYNRPIPKFLENHPAYQKIGYSLTDKKSSFNEDLSLLIETLTYKKI